ncbi:hypothetical protein DBR32_03285 [Taibaiella sp. KBW10]|uniref:S41 family peptidase n=1 Tax=Taibaiella sp. KBW10 TaxID=2153357 RepID=UPI000F59288F|nr:S41 family peptidase [Taibaiella sp. KBW10]RQO32629.1 hypothetical protein DBR32_03285 [Taibaiella sp. KBW10]
MALERLITKIEVDYPGFKEKTDGRFDVYKNHKVLGIAKSDTANSANCIKVLNDYISFFKDEHIYIQTSANNNNDAEILGEPKPKGIEVEGKLLASNIFYIKIQSFKYENIIPVKELIKLNQKKIEKAKALIIDIRDNFGGTDDVYQPLLPYILTNPLRIMNVEFLSTNTLINGLREYAMKNVHKDSLKAINQIEEGLKEYKDNLGKFILYDGKKVTIDTISLKSKTPKQIIILANKNVASAGENFLFSARQSKKVKILGTPSMGVLDYGSIREFKFGCEDYILYLPTYRSARLPQYPIDNIGIQPDVFLDDTVGDWLQFAIKYINE